MLLATAQVRLEDVFKSTQESMSQPVGGEKLLALVLVVLGLVVLLVLLQYRRSHQIAPRALKNPNKLLREVTRSVALKSAEVRQLRKLADEQKCASPLVLLLCPSLLAKGLTGKPQPERQRMAELVKRARS